MNEPAYSAVVEWVIGPRSLSDFMQSAGLGVTGVGTKERITIDYKPGEEVTEERVMQAVQYVIDQSNATKEKFQLSCPKFIRIYERK